MGDSHKPLLRFNEFARVVHRTQRNICLHLPVYCKRCYEGHKDTLDTWQSSGRDSELSLPRDQVQSPVGELTCSSKKKKKGYRCNRCTTWWKKEMLRERDGESGVAFPGSLWARLQHLQVFTNSEALWSLCFCVFKEPSLHRHDWLNHWP